MRLASLARGWVPVALLVLAGGGCASGGGSGSERADPDVITLEELEADPTRDLLTTVERLRPRWMRPRTSRTFVSETRVSVIIDGVRQQGGLDALRHYLASQALELRYMSAADATTRFGVDMAGGAIVVSLRR